MKMCYCCYQDECEDDAEMCDSCEKINNEVIIEYVYKDCLGKCIRRLRTNELDYCVECANALIDEYNK